MPPPYMHPATWPVRSYPAPDQPDAWFIHPRYRRWGSAVVVFNPTLEFEPIGTVPLNSGVEHRNGRIWISHPGSWVGITLKLAAESRLVLISGYGLLDDFNPKTKLYYATTTVHRMLSDLTPLIDSDDGRLMVIAGDLNVGDAIHRPLARRATSLGADA